MKRFIILIVTGTYALAAFSQQKEGKVLYERSMQMKLRISDSNAGEQEVNRTNTDKFELLFGNNQILWRASDEELPEAEGEGPGGGMQIRMIGSGPDDISYFDLNKGTSSEQREMFEKKFVIMDSIKKLNWKLTGETKNILNHACQQATTQRIGTRMSMNMDNGKMERKEVADTSNIIAWFAPDIPVASGPSEFQGQLPGLILEMDVNNGRQKYKATEISLKADIAAIKEPQKGKRVTRDEFRKEADKMMQEMEKNNQGGRRMIRVN
jgi:GLPGLI family protein